MASRRKTTSRREAKTAAPQGGRGVPLRSHAEQALDSYPGTGHNYYLYFDPSSGLATVIPWDVNEAYGSFTCNRPIADMLDWSLDEADRSLLRFARRLIALRRAHPTFRRPDFFQGRPLIGGGRHDIQTSYP